MQLSPKQKAILISLYRRYIDSGRRDTFVPTKGITSVTMKSMLKTGFIETDRAIKGVPSNMRISDAGVEVMNEYFATKKKSLDAILTRNRQFMRFVQNTDEKRIVLMMYLAIPMIESNIEITHKGFGIFEVHYPGQDEQYYGVYNLTEGNDVEIGGCEVRDYKSRRYYIEKIRVI